MKEITLDNPKLKKLLEEKGLLINQGRSISEELESIENQMQEIDKKLVDAEAEIDITDLNAEAEYLTKEFNILKEQMDELNKQVRERLSSEVPKELTDKYDTLKKMHTELEEERNKIALKAQKYNDKIIPIVQKLLTPHLQDEFDDFGSVEVVDGVIKGQIFNHLEDFKNAFRKRKQ
jgi:predicted  nucleic acid-binding Zn-ribbon protein